MSSSLRTYVLCQGGAALGSAGFVTVLERVDRVVLRSNSHAVDRIRMAREAAGIANGAKIAWSAVVLVVSRNHTGDVLDLAPWLPTTSEPGLGFTATARALPKGGTLTQAL